jgi:hypothetical protein
MKVKLTENQELFFSVEPKLKKLILFNIDGEEMEDEESAISGIVNLKIKKAKAKYNTTLDLNEKLNFLP